MIAVRVWRSTVMVPDRRIVAWNLETMSPGLAARIATSPTALGTGIFWRWDRLEIVAGQKRRGCIIVTGCHIARAFADVLVGWDVCQLCK